jgi:hypothetical protein
VGSGRSRSRPGSSWTDGRPCDRLCSAVGVTARAPGGHDDTGQQNKSGSDHDRIRPRLAPGSPAVAPDV